MDEFIEKTVEIAPLWAFPGGNQLVGGWIQPADTALDQYGIHDANPVALGSQVERLCLDFAELGRLNLDKLAAGAHKVDHLALHKRLVAIPGAGKVCLQLFMKAVLGKKIYSRLLGGDSTHGTQYVRSR